MGERPVDLKDLFLKIEMKLLNIFRIDTCKKISRTEIQVINGRLNVIRLGKSEPNKKKTISRQNIVLPKTIALTVSY